jgi:hypothetical protein
VLLLLRTFALMRSRNASAYEFSTLSDDFII